MDASNLGIIILAAGSSTRLGEAKQLVKFQNKTLISNAIETALNSKCSDITLVLGSNSEKINREIKDFVAVKICINENWQSGMASSIKCGLEFMLKENPEVNAVIFMLCDQPLITSKHINLLFETFAETNKGIVASEYENTLGVPALFSSEMFGELLKIRGDKGAKKIIDSFPASVKTIHIPEAEFDVDTFEDVQKLSQYQ